MRRSSSSWVSNVEAQPFKFNFNAFKTDMYYGSNMLKGTCIFGHQPSNASGISVELAACDLDPGEEMMNTDHAIPGSIIQQSRSTEDSCSAKSDEMCASHVEATLMGC